MDRKIEGYYFGDTNEYFNFLWFLSKILSDDEGRYNMEYIYVDDKNIVSTDGRILAILGNNADIDIEPGYYKPIYGRNFIILKKENEPFEKYPNYERVIPDFQDYHNYIRLNLNYSKEEMVYRIARNISLKLNPDYLKLIPPGDYDIYFQETQDNDATVKPVVFVSGLTFVKFWIVIAPMKEKEYPEGTDDLG